MENLSRTLGREPRMSLNVASYAEELGLNPGVMEDRRYAAELGFQI
jgi:hypothetical protein